LDNYANFQDIDDATFNVVKVEKAPDCLVCGERVREMEFDVADKLLKLLEIMNKDL
jgi:hypothetical protein